MNVLIYEDENIYIDKLRIVLSKYNVNLTVCSTADDFLNCSQVFDIAFVDIEVEGLDGLNATRILKTRSKNCIVVRILIMTVTLSTVTNMELTDTYLKQQLSKN